MNAGRSDYDLSSYQEKQKCVEEVGEENLKIIDEKLTKFLKLVQDEENAKCEGNQFVETFIKLLQELREKVSETDDNANQKFLHEFNK